MVAWMLVDNSNLIDFWNSGGGKNMPLTNEIKDLFHLSLKLNIVLNLFYIPSESNDADSPSRVYSDSDCSLAGSVWDLLQSTFGPHSVDMTALPSNVMKDQNECNLKFFSPLPFYESSGINVFAQDLSSQENYYVFPPFILIGPLLNFLLCSQAVSVTIIVPDLSPRKYWWPILISLCIDHFKIGSRGQRDVILFPLTPNMAGIQDLYLGTCMFLDSFSKGLFFLLFS